MNVSAADEFNLRMNWAHLHLIINHVPFLGIVFGLFLLVVGLYQGSDAITKTALMVFIFIGFITVLVYYSGDFGEEQFETLSEVSRKFLVNHEDTASIALIGTSTLGVLAFVGLLLFPQLEGRKGIYLKFFIGAALIAAGLLGQTANLGGKIFHPEIREDFFIFRKPSIEDRLLEAPTPKERIKIGIGSVVRSELPVIARKEATQALSTDRRIFRGAE